MDIRTAVDLHTRAATMTAEVVRGLAPADLLRPTPCHEWDVAQVLRHLVGLDSAFVSAFLDREQQAEPDAAAQPERIAGTYLASLDAATAAFAAEGDTDRMLVVPVVDPQQELPASFAILLHLHETLAHGWDVAAATGAAYPVDDEVVAAAASVAETIPEVARSGDAPAFGAIRSAADDADPFTRYLGLLGRDSRWQPAALAR